MYTHTLLCQQVHSVNRGYTESEQCTILCFHVPSSYSWATSLHALHWALLAKTCPICLQSKVPLHFVKCIWWIEATLKVNSAHYTSLSCSNLHSRATFLHTLHWPSLIKTGPICLHSILQYEGLPQVINTTAPTTMWTDAAPLHDWSKVCSDHLYIEEACPARLHHW